MVNVLRTWFGWEPKTPLMGPFISSNVARALAAAQAATGAQTSQAGLVGVGNTQWPPSNMPATRPPVDTGPIFYENGAVVVMNVGGVPRFMNYTGYGVMISAGTIRVMNNEQQTIATIPLSATFGVYKSTSELINAWVVRNEEPTVEGPNGGVQNGGPDPVRGV